MDKNKACQAKLTYDIESDAMFISPVFRKKTDYEISQVIQDNIILDFSKKKS